MVEYICQTIMKFDRFAKWNNFCMNAYYKFVDDIHFRTPQQLMKGKIIKSNEF